MLWEVHAGFGVTSSFLSLSGKKKGSIKDEKEGFAYIKGPLFLDECLKGKFHLCSESFRIQEHFF